MKAGLVLLSLALAGACSRDGSEANPAREGEGKAEPAPSGNPSPGTESLDLLTLLPDCTVEHRGTFLDLGTPAVDARREFRAGSAEDVEATDRASVSVARVHTKRLAYDFTLTEPLTPLGVTLRAVGIASRQVHVYLDDRRMGVVALPRGDLGFVTIPPLDGVTAGRHSLILRFGGVTKGADHPFAEIDYIRIGPPDPAPSTYAPPTLRDVTTDVVLGADPRRSLVLRAPSAVRCAVRVVPGMTFRAHLGYWGSGKGIAHVRLLEDGEAKVVLAEGPVTGDAAATWRPLTVALDPYAGRVVILELSASEATGGGRVAFGEPRLETSAAEKVSPPKPARMAIVVVASGLDRRLVPPWGPVGGLAALTRLVRDGAAFERYRTPTTVVSGVMASLLTGLSPRVHGLEDTAGRLSEDARLLSERAKEGDTHAALFTGVPMSFPPFGFDRGWERSEAFSPVRDLPATEPLSRATAWLKEQLASKEDRKLLVVVHARGGHPPWDVNRDEVQLLPPAEYGGSIEPRAGALALGNLRGLRSPQDQRLSGDDWRRLRALEEAALKKEDAALRRLFEVLDREGLYDSSLLIVVGDVATGDPPLIPFGPMPPLREDLLNAPLLVKFPGKLLAGKQVAALATTVDVTRTVVEYLDLPGAGLEGVSLVRLAEGAIPLDGRPLVATLGTRYSTRYGPWLLTGELGRKPTLCLVEVDPSCATDALAQSPLAAEALWRRTFEAETRGRRARGREEGKALRVVLDAETQSALKVFGY